MRLKRSDNFKIPELPWKIYHPHFRCLYISDYLQCCHYLICIILRVFLGTFAIFCSRFFPTTGKIVVIYICNNVEHTRSQGSTNFL